MFKKESIGKRLPEYDGYRLGAVSKPCHELAALRYAAHKGHYLSPHEWALLGRQLQTIVWNSGRDPQSLIYSVCKYGEAKYGRNNFLAPPGPGPGAYEAACWRHLQGNCETTTGDAGVWVECVGNWLTDYDEESGLCHAAHVLWYPWAVDQVIAIGIGYWPPNKYSEVSE